jgi:hypothetical protein
MNRFDSDRDYGRQEEDFLTRRSERYRQPEGDMDYRYDDYGSSARGGYGNEGDWDTWGNQGDDRTGGRSRYTNINITDSDTFDTSRNYGNMGSYGGAQGFGDIRGGRHDSGHPFDSGMDSSRMNRGWERDSSTRGYSSFGNESLDRGGHHREDYGSRGYSGNELYGRDTSRRFQGNSGQSGYNVERDDYYSSNFGDDQGNYMGSGYNRTSRGEYGPIGDYGSTGRMEQGPQNRDSGMRSREFNTAQNRWNTDW